MDVFENAWKDYGEEAARLIEQYKPKLCKIVRKWTYNENDFDEMLADIMWRMPRIIENWDPCKGDMMAYIFGIVNRYCHKFSLKSRNERGRHEYLIDVEVRNPITEFVLDELSETDAYFLKNYYIEGFTYKEIAEALDVSRSSVRNSVAEALENARELFDA